MNKVIILFENSPIVCVNVENDIFSPNQLLDWYAEVYDFDRTKLTYQVVREITYNIDKDEVRKRKLDEYHAKQDKLKELFA